MNAKPTSEMMAPDPAKIKKITERIIGLPTLPTVISKMLELVDNPKTSASILARHIATDQALTSKILKTANSAYYGFSREIYTVDMAIVIMGFNAVKEMGLTFSVLDIFKDARAVPNFDVTEFWRHNICCAVASKILAKRFIKQLTGESFVAGLLHDIGKVIINQYFHDQFIEIMGCAAQHLDPLSVIETRLLGVDHGIIGGWLANGWRLPALIADSIRFHHAPWEVPGDTGRFVAIITLADLIAHRLVAHEASFGNAFMTDQRLRALLGMENDDDCNSIVDEIAPLIMCELDKMESITLPRSVL